MTQVEQYQILQDIVEEAARQRNLNITSKGALGYHVAGDWTWDYQYQGRNTEVLEIIHWKGGIYFDREEVALPSSLNMPSEQRNGLIGAVVESVDRLREKGA